MLLLQKLIKAMPGVPKVMHNLAKLGGNLLPEGIPAKKICKVMHNF
jgi:hypothetical protein